MTRRRKTRRPEHQATIIVLIPTHLTVAALDDVRHRARLAGLFGPLQQASVLSCSALVDTLLAWRGLVKTTNPVVGRLVELTGCSLVLPGSAETSDLMSFAT